jgi:oligopeptide/dipeptide ABC transporter ATP-binding protein
VLRPAGALEVVILRAENVVKEYPIRGTRQSLRAVAGVTIELERGETLGIVGESGCGKSTLARLLVRLEQPTSGRIEFEGTDLAGISGRTLRERRRRIQMVFQDPYASLDPRQRVGSAIGEVLRVHGLVEGPAAERRRVLELLQMVGLAQAHVHRHPHELSGGQRQRVSIARSLAAEPTVLVLDEPVSALDVSVRAEVMNLLASLRDRLGLSYVFISHDLSMVRQLSDRIAAMYLGRVVETGPWDTVLEEPLHPYTRALVETMPVADPEREAGRIEAPIRGEVPNPAAPPPGCPFHPRCPLAEPVCREARPPLEELRPRHEAACHVARRQVAEARSAVAEGDRT